MAELGAGARRDTLPVTGTTGSEWVWLAGAGIVGTGALTLFLDAATSSTVPFWDAVTTVLSLLATWGQATKRWESWLLWIAADLIYIPLYLHKGLTLTALLYAGFLLLCVRGLLAWRRSRATEPALAVAP
ncbi:nicotinamide riboside transporter PnuC [Prescottella defluvii]|nr:nicotinamide riboside transporter PnuC [Prescottella defluvii]